MAGGFNAVVLAGARWHLNFWGSTLVVFWCHGLALSLTTRSPFVMAAQTIGQEREKDGKI